MRDCLGYQGIVGVVRDCLGYQGIVGVVRDCLGHQGIVGTVEIVGAGVVLGWQDVVRW